jgi:hypothetical protein
VESKDKLFIISHPRDDYQLDLRHIILEVAMDDTDNDMAKKKGFYHLKVFVRSYEDSKEKKFRDCNFWPKIHCFKKDRTTMGAMSPLKPDIVEKTLREKPHPYMWYQDVVSGHPTRL